MSSQGVKPEWRQIPVGDLCEPIKLVNPQLLPDRTFLYVDVSSVSNESFKIIEAKNVLGREAPSRARKQIKANDVLFATVRPALKRVALVPASLDGHVCSTGFCVLRSKREELDSQFLYFWLLTQTVQRKVAALQNGATYPAINDSDLLAQVIALPALDEQHSIVQALRAVQEAKDARQRELALERERKVALTGYLFTHGVRGSNRAVKRTRYGDVPADWPTIPLGECSHIQTGVAKGRRLHGDDTISLPYLRVANVQDGYLNLAEIKTLTIRRSEIMRYQLQPGDVLLTEGGDFDKLGRGFIWQGPISPCIHQNHIFAVRTNRELLLPEYFAYLAQSPYGKAYFLSVAHKTTNLASINKTKLGKFPTLIPSLEEQEAINQFLGACDAKIAALQREVKLADELFGAMLEELMTGRLSAERMIEEGVTA